jgi:hypothetical protein
MSTLIKFVLDPYFLLFLITIFSIYFLFKKNTPVVVAPKAQPKPTKTSLSISAGDWLFNYEDYKVDENHTLMVKALANKHDIHLLIKACV